MDTAPGVQPPTAADFPGCKPVRLPREDTVSETAWIPWNSPS